MSDNTRTVDYDKLDFTRWLLASKPFQDWFIKRSPEILIESAHAPSVTANAYLDAIFAKESMAQSAWTRWAKESLGVDFENIGNNQDKPLLLDARGAEMLGLSRLEFVSRMRVAREGEQMKKMTSREMTFHINQIAESVVTGVAMLQRYDVIKIDDKDGIGAKLGQFATLSDFWMIRASEAVNSALQPGLVLNRITTNLDAQKIQEISWPTGSVFTSRSNQSDIRVNEVDCDSSKGGARLLGSNYLSRNTLMRVDAESFDVLDKDGDVLLLSETRETLNTFQNMVQSAVELSGKVQLIKPSLGVDPLACNDSEQKTSLDSRF